MSSRYDLVAIKRFLSELPKDVGPIARNYFGKTTITSKGSGSNDVLTEADLAVQKFLVEKIQSVFPGHDIVAEEEGMHEAKEAECVWYIDPIDGTRNFASGVPSFAVMVGFAFQGEVQASLVYLPATDETYIAVKGEGAMRNGESIHVSNQSDFLKSFGLGPVRVGGKNGVAINLAVRKLYGDGPWMGVVSSIGVAATYMSSGRRDWYISGGGGLWDYAPTTLLMREAGCELFDLEGNPWTLGSSFLAACTPSLREEMLRVLAGMREELKSLQV